MISTIDRNTKVSKPTVEQHEEVHFGGAPDVFSPRIQELGMINSLKPVKVPEALTGKPPYKFFDPTKSEE